MNLLRNSELMIIIGVMLAFIFPQYAPVIKPLIIPQLVLMMTFSMKGVMLPKFDKKHLAYAVKMVLLSYFFYSSVLLISTFFTSNLYYKIGLIMMAAAPPAVMIVPLTRVIGGDIKEAVLSEIFSYTFALVYMPSLAFILLREYINVSSLLKVLFLFILAPFILSRFLNKFKIRYDFKEVINLLMGFGFFIAISLSHNHISSQYLSLMPLFLVVAAPKFLIASFIYFLSNVEGIKRSSTVPAVLFSTAKNGNLVIVICLLLFPPQTILPVVMSSLIAPIYIFFIMKLFKKKKN